VSRQARRFLVTALLLAATLAASRLAESRRPEALLQPLDSIAAAIDGWTGTPAPPLAADVLRQLKPTTYLSRNYARAGRQLGLFLAYYAEQRAGESMHSPKNCLPGGGWEVQESRRLEVRSGSRSFPVNHYVVENAGHRMLVLYWYQSRNRIIASEYHGKLYLMRDAVVDGRTAASIVRITMADTPGALEDAVSFAGQLIPQVERCIGSLE